MLTVSIRDLLRSVLTVKVGAGVAQKSFVVHAELLSYHSSFFKAATTGTWDEAKTSIVNLPEDDPKIFGIFQDWVYGEELELDPDQAADIALILAIWVFGDKSKLPHSRTLPSRL